MTEEQEKRVALIQTRLDKDIPDDRHWLLQMLLVTDAKANDLEAQVHNLEQENVDLSERVDFHEEKA